MNPLKVSFRGTYLPGIPVNCSATEKLWDRYLCTLRALFTVPGIGEIIGGSQREDDYTKLKTRMDELGLKPEDYQFYMDLRKYGSTRHSGFGLGFERCVMYLTGMGNIRDVIPFPRTVNNCDL